MNEALIDDELNTAVLHTFKLILSGGVHKHLDHMPEEPGHRKHLAHALVLCGRKEGTLAGTGGNEGRKQKKRPARPSNPCSHHPSLSL